MIKRFPLGFFPTPLHPLNKLSEQFSPHRVYIKRDDMSGLAGGGNKTRKLEFLIGEALACGYDTLITAGAQQSNHCRQTAAACNKAGLKCHLIVRGEAPEKPDGNLFLSRLLGAEIHFTGGEIMAHHPEELIGKLRQQGHNPLFIPIGGSTDVGTLGYVFAVEEFTLQLKQQNIEPDFVFFASCSGGTQAGMVLGKHIHGLQAKLMPVSIAKPEAGLPSLEETVHELVNACSNLLQLNQVPDIDQCRLIEGYDEAGYAVITKNETNTIKKAAREEGILLDPVYTARAFYAMTDFLKNQPAGTPLTVVFWHTGGDAANFHYASQLL